MRVKPGIVVTGLSAGIEFHKMQNHFAVSHAELVRDGHPGFVQDVVLNCIGEKVVVVGSLQHAGRQRQLP
jgi:hypothetical protein